MAAPRHCVLHHLSVLLLHLASIAALLTSSNGILHASAQPINIVHAAAQYTATPTLRTSHDVLVFQTSWNLLVPLCLTQLIRPPTSHDPPVGVLIATPTDSGTYPVILFKHGFSLANCVYTQLFESLAASGYIIVAPQALTGLDSNCTDEIEETAEVANWISKSLAVVLNAALPSASVVPNMSQLVMAGHSRGGKIAFAMALGITSIKIPNFSALVTLDPVDGTSSDSLSYPPIVAAGCNHSRNQLSIPVLILGTGYGSYTGFLRPQACAPACCSHMAYFNCSSAPIMYHLVASDYGHLDFLDDSQTWTVLACRGGTSKAPLREFSADLMVAFLESALEGKEEGIESIIEKWESASIRLEEPLVYEEENTRAMKREHIQFKKPPHFDL